MNKKYCVSIYPKYYMGLENFVEKISDGRNYYAVKFSTLKEAKMFAENKVNELKGKYHLIEVLKIIDKNLYEIIEEY